MQVLCTPDPHDKAARTEAIVRLWDDGSITMPPPGTAYTVPDRPARESGKVQLVAARDVPKRGKGGSLASRQAMLHALVHIESSAVDLAWDCLARFGAADVAGAGYQLPRQFYSDFIAVRKGVRTPLTACRCVLGGWRRHSVEACSAHAHTTDACPPVCRAQVAADECRHFRLLEQRLEATGSHYGAMAAHDGLWESAAATAGSLAARLAVEHCTHEARGLDVLPQTIHRFRSNGDAASADLLQVRCGVAVSVAGGGVTGGRQRLWCLAAPAQPASNAETIWLAVGARRTSFMQRKSATAPRECAG